MGAEGRRRAPGLDVALKSLAFRRAVARAARVPDAAVDCYSVTRFYRLLRVLAATPNQGAALRGTLLRDRGEIEPPLELSPGCRIR